MHAGISPKRLIIAAASARPFVRAAVAAGYEVIAADVFCDQDTCRDAFLSLQLAYAEGGFDALPFKQALFPLMAGAPVGFVYGSGFETQPDVLEEVSQRALLIGNTPETLRALKDPGRFFPQLAALGIPFPEVSLRRPEDPAGWLRKRVGGSGGTHVTLTDASDADGVYYQRQAPGQPFSLLFLAAQEEISGVGFNAQLLAPVAGMPFRFGGAVSQPVLPLPVTQGLLAAAQALTRKFGLKGLNSIDCMVDGADYQVLEVNPRLSATFALYDTFHAGARLFEAHLAACGGRLLEAPRAEQAQAHLIYYAPDDVTIPPGMSWPQWVADLPASGSTIRKDEPLCTITAAGGDADSALRQARCRASRLTKRIYQSRNP